MRTQKIREIREHWKDDILRRALYSSTSSLKFFCRSSSTMMPWSLSLSSELVLLMSSKFWKYTNIYFLFCSEYKLVIALNKYDNKKIFKKIQKPAAFLSQAKFCKFLSKVLKSISWDSPFKSHNLPAAHATASGNPYFLRIEIIVS